MEKGHAVYSTQTKILRGMIWVFMLFMAVLMIFPVLYIVFGSFKGNSELLVGGTNILPKKWVFSNYSNAWKQANFARYTINSIFLALGVMIVSLLNSTMAGYVFSRRKFKGKEILYGIFVMFMFINVGSVSLRPLFELSVKLHMNKSLISVILISAGGGQATYLFLSRGFVNALPMELDEAAKIDGCSSITSFTKVMLPIAKPGIVVAAVFSFVYAWGDLIYGITFITDPNKRPITSSIYNYVQQYQTLWNATMAFGIIAIMPVVLIFIFMQKYIVSGLTNGAVKA